MTNCTTLAQESLLDSDPNCPETALEEDGVRTSYGRQAFVFAFTSALGGDATSDEHFPNWTGSPTFTAIPNSGQTSRHGMVRQKEVKARLVPTSAITPVRTTQLREKRVAIKL